MNEDEAREIINKLIKLGEPRSLIRGDVIYRESEAPQGLFYIEKGLVGLTKVSVSGSESLMRLFRSEQFFGHRTLFANEHYHGTAKCLEDSHILYIQKKLALDFFNENPRSYIFLVQSLAKELRRAENRSVLVSEGHIIERVAYALIFFKKLYPDHMWTRTEIANYCASRTPTVIKTLGILEEKGAIKQNRRFIEITDESALINIIEDDA
jgi:CRP-like cAMP-binding protein